MTRIYNYTDFVEALLKAGFSMGGGNSDGVFALVPWSWEETPPYDTPVRWHTGDAETDPWEWRMRVLDERGDIAYGKVFFKKSGFITKEQLLELARPLAKSQYGQYLLKVANEQA